MTRPVLDGYAVSYTPSLTGRRPRDAVESPPLNPSLCALINPISQATETEELLSELSFSAEVEGPVLARQFAARSRGQAPRVFYGEDASLANLKAALQTGVTHLHFACHGYYDWSDPTASGLHLAGRDRLTARQIISDLSGLADCQMVVLSACESGISDVTHLPSEAPGLISAFLLAGARTVMATLWPISDASTALFMSRLYAVLLSEPSVPDQPRPDLAQAARLATIWLRRLSPSTLDRDLAALRRFASDHAAEMPATMAGQDRSSTAAADLSSSARDGAREADRRSLPHPLALRHASVPGHGGTRATPAPGLPASDRFGALHWAAFTPWGA